MFICIERVSYVLNVYICICNESFQNTDALCAQMGFESKYELEAVRSYLEMHSDLGPKMVSFVMLITNIVCLERSVNMNNERTYFPIQIPGNGDCLFRSVWEQLAFEGDGPTEKSDLAASYTPYRMRLHILHAMLTMMVTVCIRTVTNEHNTFITN